mgnify:CR=1 FL=1
MHYKRLTREERYQIQALKRSGQGVRAVARTLSRSPSTISRELRRNNGRAGYWANFADESHRRRRRDVHHVGAQALARELEGRAGAGRGLEEDVDDRLAAQGGDLAHGPPGDLEERLGAIEQGEHVALCEAFDACLLYTSPSPRD